MQKRDLHNIAQNRITRLWCVICCSCIHLLLPFSLAYPLCAFAAETPQSIVFVLSGESTVYERVANATQQRIFYECKSQIIDCDKLVFDNISTDMDYINNIKEALLTVTLGIKASEWIDKLPYKGSLMHAMLPYDPPRNAAPGITESTTRIYIDQPYKRYLDLIKATIPRSDRVGLLVHESNLEQIEIIREIADRRGLTLITSIVSSERGVGEALSYLLDDIDVLLALPDSHIHNRLTISQILTTAYRNDIPVIGFSSAYAKAGAVAAVYTSPEDIALQVSDTVLDFLSTGHLDRRSQQASYFSISFNFEVARSLGLSTISPSEVKKVINEGAIE